MGVLGAEFIKPDFDAGRKLNLARQSQSQPFNNAVKQASTFLEKKQQAKLQGKKNELEMLKLQNDTKRIASQVELNKSITVKNIFEAKAKQNEISSNITNEANATLTLDESRALKEKMKKTPELVTDDEIRQMKFTLDPFKDTSKSRQVSADSAYWTSIMNDRTSDFYIKNQNTQKEQDALGNSFDTMQEANEANANGMYQVKPLVTGATSKSYYVDKTAPSQKGLAKANSILDDLEAKGGNMAQLPPDSREYLYEMRGADEDINKRMIEITQGTAPERFKSVQLPEGFPQDAVMIGDKVTVLDDKNNPIDIFDLVEQDPDSGKGRELDFKGNQDAVKEDGTFQDFVVVRKPPFAVLFERVGDEKSSIYQQQRVAQERVQARDFSGLFGGDEEAEEAKNNVLGSEGAGNVATPQTQIKVDPNAPDAEKSTAKPTSVDDITKLF